MERQAQLQLRRERRVATLQFRSEQNWVVNGITGVFDDSALRMGYIVADNSLTDQLYNANAVLVVGAP